jgi:vancomycin resistance protein YoaR
VHSINGEIMSTRTAVQRPIHLPSSANLQQALLALLGGVVLFGILLIALLVGFNIYYAGRVYPGVSVAGMNLAGLRVEDAQEKLALSLTYPEQGRIVFKEGGNVWIARPEEVGLFLDPKTSALSAYAIGRKGGLFGSISQQFTAWFSGVNLPPYLVFDERIAHAYLANIATQVELPTIEATISVKGTEVTVTPGQVGRSVDYQATLAPLEGQVRSLTDGILPVVMVENPPAILDASAQAEIARNILKAPLTLKVPNAKEGDPGPWSFDQASLASMLAIERVETSEGARYQVGLNTDSLRSFLQGIAGGLSLQPANARFIFNDDTRQLEVIQPANIGRALNLEASLQTTNEKLGQGNHSVDLVFDYTNPQVDDKATAESLGIRELVSVHTSYFYGSSTSRIQNIETASARFHGVLVPPGETFSMGDVLGDVSLDNGYAEALIIYGNRTIKGVGGGVCQVSTTLFRTAFLGGYPIVERHSHAYRVSYYEQTASGGVDPNLAGLDATVFVPVVDFKFTNDTPNWLLMETYVNPAARTLTWKFYSTSDGRSVEWDTTGLQNIEDPPEPLYQENPDLGEGEIRQVDWEAAGADVTVFRTVYRDGQVYLQDQFSTHYMPWQAVYEYGPGTRLPKDRDRGDN